MSISRYISILWIGILMNTWLSGCVSLQPTNPVVERSKRYRPIWADQSSGVVREDMQSKRSNFLYVKKGQKDLLQAVKQAEWEGRNDFFKQGAIAPVTMEDLYYEGKLDVESRQKCFDIYILFASSLFST
jgi:hypothetical protein